MIHHIHTAPTVAAYDALAGQLAEARERIAQLEEALGQTATFARRCKLFGLTPGEARVFGVILTTRRTSKSAIYDCIYGAAEYSTREPPQPKIIDTRLCRLRQKLGPFKISILTISGVCIEIDEQNAARARELLSFATEVAREAA